MHRFFLKQDISESGNLILAEKPLIHQMRDVLKLKAGESVLLFNGSGRNFEFRIAKISPQAVFGHITGVSENKRDPIRQIYLYQALIKKNNFEWVLQKCTELGVKKFIPVLSERSIKKGLNRERAEKIMREAVEQSGQDKIPEITEPITFSESLTRIGEGETLILCDQSGALLPHGGFFDEKPIHPVRSSAMDSFMNSKKGEANSRLTTSSNGEFSQTSNGVHIFVGPEGGCSEKEINAVRERGGLILSLGQRVLRAETASVAVVSLALALIFKE